MIMDLVNPNISDDMSIDEQIMKAAEKNQEI